MITGKIIFFPLPDFVDHITHIALSPNKKNLFICEQHQSPQGALLSIEQPKQDIFLSIYDLKNPEQPRISKAHINVSELITSNHNALCILNQ